MKTMPRGAAAVAPQFRSIEHAPQTITSLAQVDLTPAGPIHPSPADWGDQLLYFLLPDRFSDGNEDQRPLCNRSNPEASRSKSVAEWMKSGCCYQGGKIKGIESKLDYLKSLGITTIWIAPIFKQRSDMQTYHGYGIQNFLEIEPRLGPKPTSAPSSMPPTRAASTSCSISSTITLATTGSTTITASPATQCRISPIRTIP